MIGARNLTFLKSLPVCLEFPDEKLRFVHAEWDKKAIDSLHENGILDDQNRVKFGKWPELAQDGLGHKAIATLVTGTEIPVPPEGYFKTPDGKERHKARLKWWEGNPNNPNLTNGDVLFDIPPGTEFAARRINDNVNDEGKPDYTIRNRLFELQQSEGITVFGHYWQEGEFPKIESPHAICVDQSVAKGGYLAAITVENGKVVSSTSVKSRELPDKGQSPSAGR